MNNNFNNFNNMDDIFNQLMGNMGGYSTERRRYSINGREVTPEEFAIYRQTGRLPQTEEVAHTQAKGQIKSDGILAKLGRNLTQDAREGKLIQSLDEIRKSKKHLKSWLAVRKIILFWSVMRVSVKLR